MSSAFVTALAVLLVCAATARGGRVPDIPAGHRAQYSLQHADGSFKYGWDTGHGATAKVEGDAHNEVRGTYSAGPGLQVHYTAGVNGFVPTLVADGQGQGHAPGVAAPPPPPPTPPPQAHGVKGWSTGWSIGAPAVYAPAVHAPAVRAPASVKGAHVGPAGPLRPDGSYSFAYSTGDQARHESGDAANNVRGSFSFRSDDGDRTVNYHAGANTGFVAQGAHLPTPPPPQPVLLLPAVAIPVQAVQIPVQSNGRWGQAAGQGAGQWGADEPEPEPSGPADASYQFAFQGKDGSRQEAADAGGNVQGSYSYTSPDGVQRRVDYEAGAGKGFVANVQPKEEPSVGAGAGVQTSWQSGDDDGLQQVVDSAQQLGLGDADVKQHSVGGEDNTQSSRGPDGSYAFSYSTKDQSREEHADAKNNVEGSYTFVAKDDGKERRVDYIAGAKTGFVAQLSESDGPAPTPGLSPAVKAPSTQAPAPAAEEPVGQEPIDGQEQTTEAPDLDIRVDDKIDLRFGTGGDDVQQTTVPDDSQQTTGADEGSGAGPDAQSSRGPDGSYAFSYSTKDQSREEQADAKNNVKGSFSFVAPDGVSRRVDYEAGAGKGFVAKGDHLPKQTEYPGTEAMSGQDQQTQQSWDDGQQTQSPEDGAEQQTESPEDGDGGDAGSGDGSYAYSYETPDSRKQESADASGNVQGSFSYNDGTGQTKTVTYTARRGEGFKASGDHLPKPGQFLAAAAAAGVGGSVHGGAYGRGRGGPRPAVGIKSLRLTPTWPLQPAATWPNGLHPQGPASLGAVQTQDGPDASVRTYLPPGVPGHKVGYVYEAKGR